MNKKIRFLAVALIAVTVFSFGSCDVKTKIEQLRCEHTMDDGEVVKMATCADVGEKVFTCTLCGYTENEDIPAKGHIWQNVEAVSPACTEDGNTSGVNCKVCGEWFIESEKIPATGHVEHAIQGYAPTCTETGLTDGSLCIVCDEQVIRQEELPANGHNVVMVAGKEPTCAETGLTDGSICTVCDEVIIAQEVLPVSADHLDVDRNYYCDNCNTVCPLKEGTYSEVGIEEGDSLLNRWIRIYRVDDFFSNRLVTSCGVDFIAINDDTFPKYNTYIFQGGPFYGLKSFCVNVTNEYIDFYFAEGTYELYYAENGEGTGEFVSIDETTTIINGSSNAYCLVPIEA